MTRFVLPTKPTRPKQPDLNALRRAMLLEMYGSLKWFGEIDSGDALELAEKIRRRKKVVQFPVDRETKLRPELHPELVEGLVEGKAA